MINNEEFAKRLKKVLDYYQLSASAFAEKIGVQRSSISHLLSGRNKPSLDFILKVLNNFNEVELYWLLNGIGSFPKNKKEKQENEMPAPTLFSQIKEPDFVQSEDQTSYGISNTTKKNSNNKEIDRIVIFYKDGSFDAYNNE